MNRAPRLLSQTLTLARRSPIPQPVASIAAAATADRSINAGGGAAYSSVAAPRSRWWNSAPPFASASRSTSFGLAGALSFSLSLVTSAEAKEAPPVRELLPKEVILYQYEACPFCNKVKAFLDYHAIPYKVVEVNPLSKKEIKWSDYKKVPILMVDGEQLIESSEIIKKLNQRLYPESNEDEEEKKWLKWVDDHLVHVLSPNIYRTTSEALESFDYITKNGNFSSWERFSAKYAGAAIMYMVSKKLKKKYNISDERAALYDAADTWTSALGGRDFLGGSKPNLADLAVFGVLRPIRYLKSGKDMVANTKIGEWYDRMENAVGEPSGAKI